MLSLDKKQGLEEFDIQWNKHCFVLKDKTRSKLELMNLMMSK